MKSHQFEPFLSGISATDPTFSRDGKWVTYASYPDRNLWRSRSDGSERMQLTYPPVEVHFPYISPNGTRVAFDTDKGEIYVISMEGGQPQKTVEGVVRPGLQMEILYPIVVSLKTARGELSICAPGKNSLFLTRKEWAVIG
jgi:WD40-like Beta Propeller Repeat